MPTDSPIPLGLRLRRARRAAGLSQSEVARRASVSQPLVSYYERSTGEHFGEKLEAIVKVLGLPPAETTATTTTTTSAPEAAATAPTGLSAYRMGLIRSLDDLRESQVLDVAYLDRPAGPAASGDLGFAMRLHSHVVIGIVDGTATGDQAAVGALLQTASLVGAMRITDGIVWPDELLESSRSLPSVFGAQTLAASFVAVLDLRRGELAWSSDRFPAPLLRNKRRVATLRGERRGTLESGRTSLAPDWLLVIGTDGVAHAPTRDGNILWDSRDIRQLIRNVPSAAGLIDRLREKLKAPSDDAFAVTLASR